MRARRGPQSRVAPIAVSSLPRHSAPQVGCRSADTSAFWRHARTGEHSVWQGRLARIGKPEPDRGSSLYRGRGRSRRDPRRRRLLRRESARTDKPAALRIVRRCQRTSTNSLEQSRHQYSHRTSLLFAETRPSAVTRALRQEGQMLSRVVLGPGRVRHGGLGVHADQPRIDPQIIAPRSKPCARSRCPSNCPPPGLAVTARAPAPDRHSNIGPGAAPGTRPAAPRPTAWRATRSPARWSAPCL